MTRPKLQMQITIDGFVAGPEGQLDWMTPTTDERIHTFIDTSDTIILGRKMTKDFINHWEQVITQPHSPEYSFAQKMVSKLIVIHFS